jgi:hypothetical protein
MIALLLALSAPTPPVAPPVMPRYVTIGSFRCDVKNEKGDAFTLKGVSSAAEDTGQSEISVFEIEAPAKLRIAGTFYSTLKVDSFTMKNFVNHSNHLVVGVARWTSLSLIGDPHGRDKKGAVFLSSVDMSPSKESEATVKPDRFIGFCDYSFSSALQNVKK